MLLVNILKCMFLIKNLRVYNIGKLSAAFRLSGPLCATFPYMIVNVSGQGIQCEPADRKKIQANRDISAARRCVRTYYVVHNLLPWKPVTTSV